MFTLKTFVKFGNPSFIFWKINFQKTEFHRETCLFGVKFILLSTAPRGVAVEAYDVAMGGFFDPAYFK